MAAEILLVRSGTAMGVSLSVVKLEDRRPTGTSGVIQEFCLQRQVEEALYGNGFSQQTGATYRLLQRSGVGKLSVSAFECIKVRSKRSCIAQDMEPPL